MKRKTLKPYQLTPTKLAKAMPLHFSTIHKDVSFDDGLWNPSRQHNTSWYILVCYKTNAFKPASIMFQLIPNKSKVPATITTRKKLISGGLLDITTNWPLAMDL